MTFDVAHWDTWDDGMRFSIQGDDIIDIGVEENIVKGEEGVSSSPRMQPWQNPKHVLGRGFANL